MIGTPINNSARIVTSGVPGLLIQGDGILTLDEDVLELEMARFADLGVKLLIGLVEGSEITPIAYEDISDAAGTVGIQSVRLPIADFGAPSSHEEPHWQDIRAKALRILFTGDSVAIHCLAGIGRSGTMAACLLTYLGFPRRTLFKRFERCFRTLWRQRRNSPTCARFQLFGSPANERWC